MKKQDVKNVGATPHKASASDALFDAASRTQISYFCLLHFCQCHVNLFGFAGTDISQRDRIPSLILVLDCVQFFCGADRLILNAGDNITRL